MTALEPIDGDATLAEVRAWMQEQLATRKGTVCPCCDRFAKRYHRKITSTSVRGMIALYRQAGMGYGHIATVMDRQQADETKMAYWGLIVEERTLRPDGGRAGYWAITPKGLEWLMNLSTVPKYVWTYNGEVLGFDGEQVSVLDALGTKFSYAELMTDQ